jgi:2-polyprenyl-3-methyl-5-hydroxy-6-metoxy-1,4-benzoquinol methylase
MSAKEHYDRHLGDFYSWMAGDFETGRKAFQSFLEQNGIFPGSNKTAIDLGAGNGIQSVSLARLGFRVKAVDFNRQLLAELETNRRDLPIEIIRDDIRAVKKYAVEKPGAIVCWGDTLPHLESLAEIEQLISDAADVLAENGKLILSFRDYSLPLTGDARFIPVKADETKILTCCLDYENEKVRVTDILHYKTEDGWRQKVSSYYKVRVSPAGIEAMVSESGLKVTLREPVSRLFTIIGEKI